MMAPLILAASASLADPPDSSVLSAAVSWAQAVLLGSIATSLAVIAVASIGFMMLAGRLNIRRGVMVIAGCFILFGASSIVAGFRSAAGEIAPAPPTAVLTIPPPAPMELSLPRPSNNSNYDPYAGAAVPQR